MVLYIPCLPPGAIPPLNYPPRAPANLGAVCVAMVIGGAVATHLIPRLLLPVDSDSGVVAWITSVAELPVFLLVGYHHVSARVLMRPTWFDSRYGGPGELLKLLCLAPVLVLAGCHVGTACARSLLQAGWIWVCFVAALHFTLLDNAPILQRFGLMFSAPSKWRQCRAVEVVIGAVLTVVALSLVASLSTAFVQGGAHAVVALAARLGTLGALLAAAWLPRWATHSFHLHHYVAALAALPWTAASIHPGCVPYCADGARQIQAYWTLRPQSSTQDPGTPGSCPGRPCRVECCVGPRPVPRAAWPRRA